jgi:hypothetical protein
MITQFDKVTCKLLAQEIEDALAAVAQKHGLTVAPAGGSYDALSFTSKIKFQIAAGNPNLEDAERVEFTKYCAWFDLSAAHYGAKITLPKYGEVTLIGFAPSRTKFPVKTRDANGVVRLFQREVAARFKVPS